MTFKLEDTVALLGKTPYIVRSQLQGISDSWVRANEGPGTWSPYDVLGHLIYGEKIDWIPRLEIILNSSANKTFKPFDRYAQFKESEEKSIENLLVEFEALRTKNLDMLRAKQLNTAQLTRHGIHPDLGKVTLQQLLAAWVVHDQGHIAQIARVLAKQYRIEVGPWTKYLTILNHIPKEED